MHTLQSGHQGQRGRLGGKPFAQELFDIERPVGSEIATRGFRHPAILVVASGSPQKVRLGKFYAVGNGSRDMPVISIVVKSFESKTTPALAVLAASSGWDILQSVDPGNYDADNSEPQ